MDGFRLRRWDVRWRRGYLTDGCGRYGLYWTRRGAFKAAAWVNDIAARHGSLSRVWIEDRRTGEVWEPVN